MTQMNLPMRQTHRHRLVVTKGGVWGWTVSLRFSDANYIYRLDKQQGPAVSHPVINHSGKEYVYL